MERFTDPWAARWAAELDQDTDYRRHAERWQGGILFVVEGEAPRKVFLDLEGGRCRAGRAATPEDEAAAPYEIRADLATWEDVLGGRLDPLYALMRGRLRLSRGSLASLLPYTAAAKAMVAAAGRL